jgi:hypothetical protein
MVINFEILVMSYITLVVNSKATHNNQNCRATFRWGGSRNSYKSYNSKGGKKFNFSKTYREAC